MKLVDNPGLIGISKSIYLEISQFHIYPIVYLYINTTVTHLCINRIGYLTFPLRLIKCPKAIMVSFVSSTIKRIFVELLLSSNRFLIN